MSQVRAAESVIPYVMSVVCIVLGVDRGDLFWEGVSARPYIVWGDRVNRRLSPMEPMSWCQSPRVSSAKLKLI
jgi:hypothetical protein